MRFEKCRQLIGSAALEKLKNAKVAVFGVGGVGGFVAEALARSGVGGLCLVDKDVVDETNVNRQIVALTDTVGMYKTDIMKERIMQINPDAAVEIYREFYLPENAGFTDIAKYDYVVDAMDNVTAKTELICRCKAAGTPVISAMGAGNRLDPTKLKTADISRTDTASHGASLHSYRHLPPPNRAKTFAPRKPDPQNNILRHKIVFNFSIASHSKISFYLYRLFFHTATA